MKRPREAKNHRDRRFLSENAVRVLMETGKSREKGRKEWIIELEPRESQRIRKNGQRLLREVAQNHADQRPAVAEPTNNSERGTEASERESPFAHFLWCASLKKCLCKRAQLVLNARIVLLSCIEQLPRHFLLQRERVAAILKSQPWNYV